jgi:hypothetical protein
MNKSSIISLLGIAIVSVILVLAGNQDIPHKPGSFNFGDIFIALRTYFITIGVVSYVFAIIIVKNIKKEKNMEVYSILDSIINGIYLYVFMLGAMIIGMIGIAGYLV